MTEYVELHAASAFSFLEGASLPEALMDRASEIGMPTMALLYGAALFHTMAKKKSVRAHIGAEIAVSGFGSRLRPASWLQQQQRDEPVRLPLLCTSREGYQNLCQLITRMKMVESTKGEGTAALQEVAAFSRGLVCLTGGEEGPCRAWRGQLLPALLPAWRAAERKGATCGNGLQCVATIHVHSFRQLLRNLP